MEVTGACSFIFLLLLFEYATGENEKTLTPPRIVFPDSEEYIINTGEDLTLRCEGKEPISWTEPNNKEYNEYTISAISSTFRNESTAPNSDHTYMSVLIISNASFMNTGYYYCHKKDTTDFNDLHNVSNVYIYVRDPEQLSVLSEMPYAMMASQYSQVVLPCRPTSPDVDVKLYEATGDEVHLSIPGENGTTVTFDPRLGFIINKISVDYPILYTCHFRRENSTCDATIILSVIPRTYSIAKPYIEELSYGYTVVGEKLELKCTLKVSVLFVMEWITPNKNHSGQIHVSKSIKESHDMYYQLLTIEHATPDDQGDYICVVKNDTHKNNSTKFVRIFAEPLMDTIQTASHL